MFTRPPELEDETIIASLSAHWSFDAIELTYEPVGYGAHHWSAVDETGDARFLTVHDLTAHRDDDRETEDRVFERLIASFGAARALHQGGVDAVLAPTPSDDGRVADRLDERFTLAVHPFLDGRPAGEHGAFPTAAARLAALDVVVEVHRRGDLAVDIAGTDDLVVPHAAEIPAAIDALGSAWDAGPYGERARSHLMQHAVGMGHLLTAYQALADQVRQHGNEPVLTHGEPHAGNVLIVDGRSLLIDWDTVLIAPPERDLWHVDPGDGSILDAYRERTGVCPYPEAVDLYRLWWDLTETGQYLGLLRRPHLDTTDVAMAWQGLQQYLDPAARWPTLVGGTSS